MSKQLGELLVEGKNVVKDFPLNSNSIKQSKMRAINDVSFKMYKSRGLSVVGESGSGKSTTAKMIAKMYAPTDGIIEYKGRDIQDITSRQDLMAYREGVQMVWQEGLDALEHQQSCLLAQRCRLDACEYGFRTGLGTIRMCHTPRIMTIQVDSE